MRDSHESGIDMYTNAKNDTDAKDNGLDLAANEPEEPTARTSRRVFLEKGSKFLGALAAFGFTSKALAGERNQCLDTKQHFEQSEEEAKYVEIINEVSAFTKSFNEIDTATGEPTPKPIGIRGKDKAHEMFVDRFKEKIQWALEKAFTPKDIEHRKNTDKDTHIIREDRHILYDAMKQFNALGLYYSFSSTRQPNPDVEEFEKQAGWPRHMFETRTADYIPFQKGYANSDKDLREAMDIRNRRPEDRENLKNDPGLSRPENIAVFTMMIQDPDIRQLFEKQDTTIAEMYSILKAFIKMRTGKGETDPEKLFDKELAKIIIKKLLAKREQFKKVEFLGPHTKHFISFSHPEEKDDSFNRTSAALKNIVRKNQNLQVVHLQPSVREDGGISDAEGNKLLLRLAIQKSGGETFINFEAHGGKGQMYLGGDTTYTPEELAEDLVTRLETQNKPGALADVRILNDCCFSTDFTERLGKRIYELLNERGLDAAEIRLPVVANTAQSSSLAHGNAFADTIRDFQHILAKEKRISGEFMMRYVQPALYHAEDMTFFLDTQPDIGFTEIGKGDSHTSVEQLS